MINIFKQINWLNGWKKKSWQAGIFLCCRLSTSTHTFIFSIIFFQHFFPNELCTLRSIWFFLVCVRVRVYEWKENIFIEYEFLAVILGFYVLWYTDDFQYLLFPMIYWTWNNYIIIQYAFFIILAMNNVYVYVYVYVIVFVCSFIFIFIVVFFCMFIFI